MNTTIQNNESRWTLIANGKPIANGSTIRQNGKVSHYTATPKKDEKKEKKKENELATTKEIHKEAQFRNYKHDEVKCPSLKVNTSSIKFCNEALTTVISQLKWRECKGNLKLGTNTADLYWHGAGFDEGLYNKTGIYAVNKLPGMIELSQKIHLSKIIKRMQMLFPGEFNFYPQTWFLPEQYHQFVAEVSTKSKSKPDSNSSSTPSHNGMSTERRNSPEQRQQKKKIPTYIVKPDCGSQGDGIYLINDPRDVQDSVFGKPAVVQAYIDDPLLLDNFKFDLRMYVTIARLDPVEIYLCKDGLARLGTVEYQSPRSSNIDNTFMHLTNYSLNKYSDDFILTNAEHTGSKRTYRGVRHILQKRGYDIDKIHQEIVDLVVKTVLSLIPDILIWNHVTNRSNSVRSFQILGFDILLTSDLKPHLLEVNSSPSMGIDSERETEPGSGVFETVTSFVDEQIKVPLLRDVLRLIAYGENEIDLEKSCLERVYPISPSTNRENPRKLPQKTKKFHSLSQSRMDIHPSVQTFSPDPKSFPGEFLLSSDDHKENKQIDLRAKSENWSRSQIDHSRSINNFGSKQQREVKHALKRDEFENPLLRGDYTPRQYYPAKKPKKFTVVKYRQEYAISTEEWRLFQLRSKVSSQLVALKNTAKPLYKLISPKTPRYRSKTPTNPKPEPIQQKPSKDLEDLCKICGHYLEGVGPGLFYVQQQHKPAIDSNQLDEEETCNSFQPSGNFEESSFENSGSKQLSSDWESDSRLSHVSSIPPRSIYFDFAQMEANHHQIKTNYSQNRKFLGECEEENEDGKGFKDICASCMEEAASVASSSDDFKLNNRTLSLISPRFQSNARLILSRQHAQKREKFSIQDLLLVKRAAAVFIFFNGIKPSLRISATSFRNMARKCHLCESGAMPAIDILFIDVMRNWQRQANDHHSPYYESYRHKNPITTHQPAGLPFQGFLEAIFRIAKAKFKGVDLKEKFETLIVNCEQYIKEADRTATRIAKKRNEAQLLKQRNQIQVSTPRISCGMSTRQPYF